MPDAPKIEIASRVFTGGTARVKGFLQGTDLKSAGIFDGDTKTRDIDVASTPGEQRINFDFSIEQPSATQSIRVADVYGREAQALVTPDPAAIGPMKGSEEMIEVDPGAIASRGEAGRWRRVRLRRRGLRAATTRPRLRGPAMRSRRRGVISRRTRRSGR